MLAPATCSNWSPVSSATAAMATLVAGAPGGSAVSVAALIERVHAIESLTAGLAATSALARTDIERIVGRGSSSGLARRHGSATAAAGRSATPATRPRRCRAAWRRVLVVDDDEANRDVLGRRLAKLGYGIVEARDGVEALEQLARGEPGIDLVLLDVMMPRLDGFAVLERHGPTRPSATSR